ncbi:carbohydrate ABC transporter permease [Nonomuraea sp. NN258]|uniref:carbohydrate ABC transporter permease n=1 Tax=Nonomuraea antri TaxID=2730852 RepID=UPI001569C0B7|nr:carbohydrate ABC transporter permease [Nonomuraea antri]NRQ33657.1 carbohydrate ABC transporter permease [Nonomuraea antri]
MRRLIGDVLLPRATAIALWAWVAFNLALVLWVGLQSLKDSGEVWLNPFTLPAEPQWGNYASAWQAAEFSAAALNSTVLTLLGALLIVALSAPAAYVLARSNRRVAGPLTGYFAMGLSIPLQTLVIPVVVVKLSLYTFMEDWVTGWWDNRITLLIFQVALSLPFAVFVLTGYLRSLPHEIEEAAEIDGAGPLRAFVRIVLPVARPGVMTVLVLNVIGLWNETLLVLLIAPLPEERTLPAALLNLYSSMQYSSDWGGLFAGIVILIYPMIVLYLWLGRRIVDGMTAGIGK